MAALVLSIVALALALVAFGLSTALTYAITKVVTSKTLRYSLQTEILIRVLQDAREKYLGSKESCVLSGLAKDLVMNSEIINDTHVRIGAKLYRYSILRLHRGNVYFDAKRTKLDGIKIVEIPRNKSVTYTGGIPTTYELISSSGRKCVFRIWTIGLVISSHPVYGFSSRLCVEGTYVVLLWVGMKEFAWIVLKAVG